MKIGYGFLALLAMGSAVYAQEQDSTNTQVVIIPTPTDDIVGDTDPDMEAGVNTNDAAADTPSDIETSNVVDNPGPSSNITLADTPPDMVAGTVLDTDPGPPAGLPSNDVGCSGPARPGELLASLMEGYEKMDRPSLYAPGARGTNAIPDKAGIQVHVLSLTDVDQKRSEFQLTIYLRKIWVDPRLAFKTESQGGCFRDDESVGYKASALANLWKPDFYIDNQANKIQTIGEGLWLYPDGKVFWSTQMEVKLSCKMDFRQFPYDTQLCPFGIGTYAESDSQVDIGFAFGMEPITMEQDGASVRQSLPQGGTPEWNIMSAHPVYNDGELQSAGETWSSVDIQFELKRNSEYYATFVVQPCIMFIIIGYASFFMNRSAAPARVGMSTIGFLANTNFLVAQLGQIPKLGKDVWLLQFVQMCCWFSFYCIIEYAVCNYLRRIQNRLDGQRKKMSESIATKNDADIELNKTMDEAEPEEIPKDEDEERKGLYHGFTKEDIIASGYKYRADILLVNSRTGKMYIRDEQVDVFSRYAYPVVFVAAYLGLWVTK